MRPAKYMTKDALGKLMSKAPAGVDTMSVMQELKNRGYTIEGDPSPVEPGFLQKAVASQVHQLPLYGALGLQAAAPEAPGIGLLAGGAAGRAIQQQIPQEWGGTRAASPQEAYLQQAQSGATQLAMGKGPEVAMESAKGLARRLMATSLGKYSKDALKTAETALEARVGPGFRNKAVKQMTGLIDRQRGVVNRMLERAKADGRWHDPAELKRGQEEILNDPAITEAERSKIVNWTEEAVAGRTRIPPDDLNRIRQRYDNEARAIHEAAQEKNYIAPADKLRGQWAKGMADQARAMLQDMEGSPAAVPGLREEQHKLGDLIELNRAIRGMAKGVKGKVLPYAPAAGAGTIGYLATPGNFHHRLAGGAAAAALASPQGLSNIALLLSNPGAATLLSRLAQSGAAVADATQRSPARTP